MDQEILAPKEDPTPAKSTQKSAAALVEEHFSRSGVIQYMGDNAAARQCTFSQERNTDGCSSAVRNPAAEVVAKASSQGVAALDQALGKPIETTNQTEPSTSKENPLSPNVTRASTFKELLPTTPEKSRAPLTEVALQTINPTEMFPCHLCQVTFTSVYDWMEHVDLHDQDFEDSGSLCCDERQLIMSPRSSVLQVMRSSSSTFQKSSAETIEQGKPSVIHPNEKLTSSISPLKLKSEIRFNKNQFVNPGEVSVKTEIYKCKICNQEFLSFHGLEQHMVTHKLENPNEEETNEADGTTSAESPTEEKITSIAIQLGKKTASASKKRSETSDEELSNTEEEYQCDLCNTGVAGYNNWRWHMMSHNPLVEGREEGQPWYGKQNLTSVNLEDSQSTIETVVTDVGQPSSIPKVEDIPCPVCDTRLTCQAMLRLHLKSHQGSKEQKEYEKIAASIPRKIDEQNKPSCSRMAMDASTYSYCCPVCPEQFPQPKDFKKHLEIDHGKYEGQCHICNQKFRGICNLMCHKLLEHFITPHIAIVEKPKGHPEQPLADQPESPVPEIQSKMMIFYQSICNVCQTNFKTAKELEQHKLLFH